eukprot:PLAT8013.1.p1 GENE.PLAT8013.1~~PLAT8013.1.p1  ORF type:complete len:531 (+),score=186.54 PLAT8013.1:2-1594(+)
MDGWKAVPQDKRLPGTRVMVDGFRYVHSDVSLYILSHYHADHYVGMPRPPEEGENSWSAGKIICSPMTASLLRVMHRVNPCWLLPVEVGVPTKLEEERGASITLIDANHAPGSVMVLLQLPSGQRHLHTGDCRVTSAMLSKGAALADAVNGGGQPIHTLLLDTTYAHKRHSFPPQSQCISEAVDAIVTALRDDSCLVLLATYLLGKERIALAAAAAAGTRVCVSERKLRLLRCVLSDEQLSLFTTDDAATALHICPWSFCGEHWPYFRPSYVSMLRLLADEKARGRPYKRVVGIVPTGWVHGSKRRRFEKEEATVLLFPYSEHSSFEELRQFVAAVRPVRLIPTVYHDEKDKRAILARMNALLNHTASKAAFLKKLFGAAGTAKKKSAAAEETEEGKEEKKEEEEEEEGKEDEQEQQESKEDVMMTHAEQSRALQSRKRAAATHFCHACACEFAATDAAALACTLCGSPVVEELASARPLGSPARKVAKVEKAERRRKKPSPAKKKTRKKTTATTTADEGQRSIASFFRR